MKKKSPTTSEIGHFINSSHFLVIPCLYKEKRWKSYLVYSENKRRSWEEERKRREAGVEEEEKVHSLLSGPLDPRY